MSRDETILRAAALMARTVDPSAVVSVEEVLAAVLSKRWERKHIAGYLQVSPRLIEDIYCRLVPEFAEAWTQADAVGRDAFVEQHLTAGFAKAVGLYETGVIAAGLREDLEIERKASEAKAKRGLNKTPKLVNRQAYSAIAAAVQKLASDDLLADFFNTTTTEIRILRNPRSAKYKEEWTNIEYTFRYFSDFAVAYFPPIAREALRVFVAGRKAMATTEAETKMKPKPKKSAEVIPFAPKTKDEGEQ
jgi:hypothetical protein